MSAFQDAVLLRIRCELEGLVSRRVGMEAENTHHAFLGNGVLYGEQAFNDLETAMLAIAPDPRQFA